MTRTGMDRSSEPRMVISREVGRMLTRVRSVFPAVPRRFVVAALVFPLVLGAPMAAPGQTVEVAPVAGYRFNNDLFEFAANRPLDVDGAPVVGAALNVDMGEGLWFEALYTRQQVSATASDAVSGAPMRVRVSVDQWLAGGTQEFGVGRARPFLSGLLGLTRYGADGDNELRFTIGTGGGVKMPLQRRIGLRFDSRVFGTFVDFDAEASACAPGLCLVNVDARIVWQMEFTANVVIVF